MTYKVLIFFLGNRYEFEDKLVEENNGEQISDETQDCK